MTCIFTKKKQAWRAPENAHRQTWKKVHVRTQTGTQAHEYCRSHIACAENWWIWAKLPKVWPLLQPTNRTASSQKGHTYAKPDLFTMIQWKPPKRLTSFCTTTPLSATEIERNSTTRVTYAKPHKEKGVTEPRPLQLLNTHDANHHTHNAIATKFTPFTFWTQKSIIKNRKFNVPK